MAQFVVNTFTAPVGAGSVVIPIAKPKVIFGVCTAQTSFLGDFAEENQFFLAFSRAVTPTAPAWSNGYQSRWEALFNNASCSRANSSPVFNTIGAGLNYSSIVLQLADNVAFNANDITIDFSTSSGFQWSYLAIGGDDVEVKHGSANSRTSVGQQTIAHGCATKPAYVMFVGGKDGNVSAHGIFYSVGHSDGVRQGVTAFQQGGTTNGVVAANPNQTLGYQRTTKCLAILDNVTGAVTGEASCLGIDATNITLDYSSAPGSAQGFDWVAIAGITAHVGTFNQRTVAGTGSVGGLDVVPAAFLVHSFGAATSATTVDNLRFSFGVSDGAGVQASAWQGDQDGVTSTGNRRKVRWSSDAASLVAAHPTAVDDGALDALGTIISDAPANAFRHAWSQVDATAREWIFVAFGPAWVQPPQLFTREGALQGIEGPLIWIKLYHPLIADPLVISPITLADPVTYHGGLKRALLAVVDQVQLAMSDKAGQPQANRFAFTMADKIDGDTAARIRTWLGQVGYRAVRRVEIVAQMITDYARRRLLDPFTVFRGKVDEYDGGSEFRMHFECVGSIQQRLDKPVLPLTMGELLANCPPENADLVTPLLVGRQSDEPSSTAAPVIIADEAGRGATNPPFPIAGYEDMPEAAPTGVVVTEVPGAGSLNLGQVPGNKFFIWWVRQVNGVWSDPSQFLPTAFDSVVISADGAAIETTCVDDGADLYRAIIGYEYPPGSIRASHYFETTDPTTPVTFTTHPTLGADVPITPGALGAFHAYGWAKVRARMADGWTALSADAVFFFAEGYPRWVRFAWVPVPGAELYEVYWGDPDGILPQPVSRVAAIDPTQLNGDGNVYAVFKFDNSLPVTGAAPRPKGKIPPRYGGIVSSLTGAQFGIFLVSIRPGAIVWPYIGGVRIPTSEVGINILWPGSAGYATEFGASAFYTIGAYRTLPVFLRVGSNLYNAAINAATSPDTLPATRAGATIGSGDSEIVVEADELGSAGNALSIQVLAGVGLNQSLFAIRVGDTIVVSLATDGAGAPDDPANIAQKVAIAINAVDGVVAGITGAGDVAVAPQPLTPFGGGADEGQTPGNPYQGELRVNATGVDDADDGSGNPILDLFDLFELLANSLLLHPTPSLSAAWPNTIPTYVDGTPKLNAAALAQARLDAGAVVPAGATGGRWIATEMTWGELLAEWCLSTGAKIADNEDGQLTVAVRNPAAAPVATVDHQLDILEGAFGFRDSARGFATRTPYAFNPEYDASGGVTAMETDERTAAARAAEYDEDPVDDLQKYVWRDSLAAARQLAQASLVASQHPVRVARASSVLHWLHFPIGRVIALTHPEGPHAAGYRRRKFQILGKALSPDACTVTLTLDDLRTEVGDMSFFESEEIMAAHYIGGSMVDSLFLDTDGITKPVNARKFVVNWDAIPEGYGKRVRAQVATDGGIKAAVFAYGEDDVVGGNTPIAVAASDHVLSTWGEQVFDLPRPDVDAEVEYWLLGILSSGTPEGSKLIADLEGYEL